MDILLVIAGAVALVWGGVVFLRGGLLGGCIAVLLTGTVFGYYFYHLSLGPAPVTLDRVLWSLLLVQTILWRRWGAAEPKPVGWAEIVLGLFAVILVGSTFAHDWQVRNSAPLAGLLFLYVMPLGIYWVARQTPMTARGMKYLIGFFAIMGVYLAVTSIAEMKQIWWLVYPQYIASPEVEEFFGRGRGPLMNPAGNGILLGLGLVSMLLAWPRVNGLGRAGLLGLAMVCLAGVYCTLTRCAWIGAGLGLLILLGLTLPRSWRAPVLVGSVLVAGLLAVTQWERLLAFKRDEAATAQDTAESVKLRPILARVAWNMFLDRPMLGCGYGQYVDECRYYLHDRSTDLVLEKARPFCQHNVFLSLLTETGLIGMTLFVMLLFLWTRDAWRLWQCQAAPWWIREQGLLMLVLLGNYLPNGMFHDVSLIPMVNMVLFFMAGLTRGLAARISTDQASSELRLADADIGSANPEESPPPTVGAF